MGDTGGGAVKGFTINWHWCVPDQKLFRSARLGNQLKDRPTVGEKSLMCALCTVGIKTNIYCCGRCWLCLPLAAPTSRLVWLTFNGLSVTVCACVCVCLIIIRAHLVVLFVLEMTPFMGCHLWLCCMQSAPLEWERHKNTFYCLGGCAARQVLALAIMPCIYVC